MTDSERRSYMKFKRESLCDLDCRNCNNISVKEIKLLKNISLEMISCNLYFGTRISRSDDKDRQEVADFISSKILNASKIKIIKINEVQI